MADETLEPTPPEETPDNEPQPDLPVDETPVPAEAPAETPSDVAPADTSTDEVVPATDDAVLPVEAPTADVPPDPIITDPVLPDAPADPVFDVPLPLLNPAAVITLETMPDETKTAIKDAIDSHANYWGEYQHFECPVASCPRDFLSYAEMVSHTVTDHRPEDLAAPAGTRARYDRYDNFIEYQEV